MTLRLRRPASLSRFLPPTAARFQDLGVGAGLVIAYLVITRIGNLAVTKIGISLGPVPLFLTEMFILAILAVILLTRAERLIGWMLTGGFAAWPGFCTWLLLAMSILYTALAFRQWGVLAVRDLAIFGYGSVFALTYFVVDQPEKAATAMRWFAYSGIVLAVALIGDTASGLHMLFSIETRGVEGLGDVASFGGGDVGGIIAFSMAALLAFAATESRHRLWHLGMAAICLYAIMIGQTRSAFVGLTLAAFYLFFGMRASVRLSFLSICAVLLAALTMVPFLFPTAGISQVILGFGATLHSASGGAQDANALFRLLRWHAVFDLWKANPVFGVGFGRPLIPPELIDLSETGNFNVGLPHNTYLTILARLGLCGFSLIMLPWVGCIAWAFARCRTCRFPAELFAAGAALMTMLGFAFFVLFLERPLHAASLWMMAAITVRLAERPTSVTSVEQRTFDRARRISWEKGFR